MFSFPNEPIVVVVVVAVAFSSPRRKTKKGIEINKYSATSLSPSLFHHRDIVDRCCLY